MLNRPLRLLFAVSQFAQGGAERYLYELCSALDRTRFDVHILTRSDVDRTAYYFDRLVSARVPIHAIRPHVADLRRYAPLWARRRAYRTIRHRLSSILAARRIGTFVDRFDIVACIQIENFLELQGLLSRQQGAVIHAMSNRFQYSYDPYDEFRPDVRYRFVTFDRSQTEELHALPCADVFEWPLSMNFGEYPCLPEVQDTSGTVKIGIFTRLSREKPLEPLFVCFKELTQRINATLHVYGGGDPSIFTRNLNRLGIRSRVFFKGHQPDMITTVRRDELSMCWLMSVGTLLGYSSIELAATGMPMLFWNYGTWSTSRIADETYGAVRSFASVAEFVGAAVSYLSDRQALRQLGTSLQRYVRRRHDINKNIGAIQEYYERVAFGR
jgi:glycosyltransferase involved in cell wall biosynthesis